MKSYLLIAATVLLSFSPAGKLSANPLVYIGCSGDSRFAGPQGIGPTATASFPLGWSDRLPALVQASDFGANYTVVTPAVGGTGIEYGVVAYRNGDFVTTGNLTANSGTVTITGAVPPFTGQLGFGALGVPTDSHGTLSGNVFSAQSPLLLLPSRTITGASLDFCPTPTVGFLNQSLHQTSPAVTGTGTGIIICNYGINDVLGYGGSAVTVSTTSPVLTGFSGLTPIPPGYTVGGAGIAAGSFVVSNTATTVTMNQNGASNVTGSVGGNPIISAWETAYQSLVNSALADNWTFVILTIPKAWTGNWFVGDSYRVTFNSWLMATYGTKSLGNGTYSGPVKNVYVIDTASMPIWSSNDPNYYADGLHFTPLGESLWSQYTIAGLQTIYNSSTTDSPLPGWVNAALVVALVSVAWLRWPAGAKSSFFF